MLTLITGAPGSGKSACLVSHLVDIADKGRTIYQDGIPDLTVPSEPFDPTKWHLPVAEGGIPDGAAFVVDEAQRIWRPRGAGSKVPAEIAAMETHRHRGTDGFFVTQHPNLIDANIRRLVGRHIHFRDLGILGRWWYEWPECCSQPETQWKSAPIKKRYRLPKAVFNRYKSASIHVKPIRSIPPVLVVFVVCLLGALGVGFKAVANVRDRITQAQELPREVLGIHKAASAPQAALLPASTPQPVPGPPAAASAPAQAASGVRVVQLAGCIHMGARCECISTEGESIEVDLKACHRDASRSGVGVPYPLKAGGFGASVVGGVVGTEGTRIPAAVDSNHQAVAGPQMWGWNAGEMRENLRGK